MSEFTWYSRLAILAGVFALLLQSVTSRAVGLLTVVAVFAVFGGLIAFVFGLVRDARHVEVTGVEVTDDAADTISPALDEVEPHAEPDVAAAITAHIPEETAEAPMQTQPPSGSVFTFRIDDALSQHLPPCPLCALPLRTGQIAAGCGLCGTAHHASCWIDSDFSCAVDGCAGTGSLLAPGQIPTAFTSHETVDGPRRGPSKP